MSSTVLKKFGRYFLMDRIAQGGMAEIFRARPVQKEGAGRLVVVKRIQGGYGTNKEFLSMFRSEIKVTMGFNHPNIVQVYDFGEEKKQPYIVMELVDGKSLRQVLTRCTELGKRLPTPLVAYVIEQSAGGLSYAHSFKDKISGESLSIVHRDISPQNILLSYEGNIKLIDFGIAKAAINSESTRAGIIKGKPSYLSPEQISGEPLDGRSDIFALGIVFWELLTNKKLFQADNDLAVLKLIDNCNTHVKPPSTINSSIPKELDAIILKCLSKDPKARYQSADELQRVLHRFIYSTYPDFNPRDLSQYVKQMFEEEIAQDRKRVQELSSKIEELIGVSGSASERQNDGSGLTQTNSDIIANLSEETTTFVGKSGNSPSGFPRPTLSKEALHQGRREKLIEAKDIGVSSKVEIDPLQAGQIGSPFGRNRTGTYAQTQSTKLKKSSGGPIRWLTSIAATLLLAAGIVKFGPEIEKFFSQKRNPAQEPKPESIDGIKTVSSPTEKEPIKLQVTKPSIELRIDIDPLSVENKVLINGKLVDPIQPTIRVNLDEDIQMRIERPGFATIQETFTLKSAELSGHSFSRKAVRMTPESYGVVTVYTTPSAEVEFQNRDKPGAPPIKFNAPSQATRIPAGNYQVKLENSALLLEKIIFITVKEGKSVTINENLKPK